VNGPSRQLVHDDIMDGADLLATGYGGAGYGADVAVLLATPCWRTQSMSRRSFRPRRSAGSFPMRRASCAGEIAQTLRRGDPAITLLDYRGSSV